MLIEEIQHDSLLEIKKSKNEFLLTTLREACKKIAPVWPLENFVAVNPYLGLINKSFQEVANELRVADGIQMTLPISFYQEKLEKGIITIEDVALALQKKGNGITLDPITFINKAKGLDDSQTQSPSIPTVADIASQVTKKDWNRFATARISSWAAAYFDESQAAWVTSNQKESIFKSWKTDVSTDITPRLFGLKGFRDAAKSFSDKPLEAAIDALEILEIPKAGIPLYLHCLLLRANGWSAHAARLDWDSELYGGKDGKLIEFLSVLICWEACLLKSIYSPEIYKNWKLALKNLEEPLVDLKTDEILTYKLILQEAFDLSAQRVIVNKFATKKIVEYKTKSQPKAQAIFCIDVRSEVFRRNLEMVDPQFETLGFAGFFAFPIKYIPLANEGGESQCPVLLKTGPSILEVLPDKKQQQLAIEKRILKHQAKYVWKSFKSGAVTCFGFVSPTGISYLPKLFSDSFGWTRPVPHPEQAGMSIDSSKKKTISLKVEHHRQEQVGIALEQQVQMAKNALKAMSLTNNFAKWVLIVGHGSTSVNNPHATGLDCGACGGHTGEANAKVVAAILNDKTVRQMLEKEYIHIPESTFFLACLHDTTTDEVSIYNELEVPNVWKNELENIKKSLVKAGHATRTERSMRMSNGTIYNHDKFIKSRSNDWSQVRPEWGLAGCHAFVVAHRERTMGIDFRGKSFLHSYNWKEDIGFSVLELIMTAPIVVTSWINLQYYASTVDNRKFGSGNKTLHNVTGGIGVLEGYSGDLRVGLPMQSIHDGERYQHEPLRLNVIIEAPIEAMNTILEKHESVRNLCDNEWIYLLAMNEEGQVSHRYVGRLGWEKLIG